MPSALVPHILNAHGQIRKMMSVPKVPAPQAPEPAPRTHPSANLHVHASVLLAVTSHVQDIRRVSSFHPIPSSGNRAARAGPLKPQPPEPREGGTTTRWSRLSRPCTRASRAARPRQLLSANVVPTRPVVQRGILLVPTGLRVRHAHCHHHQTTSGLRHHRHGSHPAAVALSHTNIPVNACHAMQAFARPRGGHRCQPDELPAFRRVPHSQMMSMPGRPANRDDEPARRSRNPR
jgi:hypothetical protein